LKHGEKTSLRIRPKAIREKFLGAILRKETFLFGIVLLSKFLQKLVKLLVDVCDLLGQTTYVDR
jgi:hypothetical protein